MRVEFCESLPYYSESNQKQSKASNLKMVQSALRQIVKMNKAAILSFFFVAGVALVSLPSCKSGESCDAYQGSSRSYKKKRAEIVRELPQSHKLA